MVKKLPLVFIVMMMTGCTTIPMRPVTVEDQKMVYREDTPILISSKINTVYVGVPSGFRSDQRPYVFVGILNQSDKPQVFSIENVKVTSGQETFKIYTFEELYREHAQLTERPGHAL